ncbi:MAG: helix-turn-helix domain-containing protein [Candidatus Pristimantibacillus sp.]
MHKTIVVDDEKWIVEGIKVGVNWQEYGFEVIADAENGQEALQLIEQLRPDIVFTDIKMPILNGLELIQRGKVVSPDTLFVVLSGHAEFAYAQKAINYGTFGYCLKPFEIEEIHGMLKRLSQFISSKKKVAVEGYSFELYEAICSNDNDSLNQLLQANDMPLTGTDTLISIVVQSKELCPVGQEVKHLSFPMSRRRNGYLVHDSIREDFLRILGRTNKNNEYSIGIGYAISDLSELEASLEAASHAAYGKFVTGNSGIYHAAVAKNSPIEEKLKEISHALYHKDRVQFVAILESTRDLFHEENFSIKDAYLIYSSVMYLFTFEGSRTNSRFFEGYEQLDSHYRNVNVMIDHLIELTLASFAEEMEAHLSGISHKKLKEIVLYIQKNFNQEISIQSLADKFFLSPNYLCQLFKKEVGETIVEYLSRLRIEYACKLLIDTKLSIYQVGEKCGFQDYFYFTRIFKRMVKLTPTQYRERK